MHPKHVILISIDDLRFDAVRWQPDQRYWATVGINPRLNTPTMDALAEECVLFTKCVSNAGYTPLSHATLFTGTYAHRHGVVNFHNTTCNPQVTTISEYFSRSGFRTMLLSAKPRQRLFCEANRTLRHIDERFDDDEEFLAALQARRHENVFSVIHVCDVHDPVVRGGECTTDALQGFDFELFLRIVFNAVPAEPGSFDVLLANNERVSFSNLQGRPPGQTSNELKAHLQRLYQAYLYTCGKFDRLRFRKLIEGMRAAGAWDRTLLVVLSDHGESQSWYGRWHLAHGSVADETVIRVPLMMKLPDALPRQIDHLTGLVDVMPTILDAVGIDATDGELDGRSLLPTVERNCAAGSEYWIEGWSHQLRDDAPHIVCRALRRADGRKYVWHGDTIQWDQLGSMTDSEFEEYCARMAFGDPPTPWFRKQMPECVSRNGREKALQAILTQSRPRHLLFENVDDDLTGDGMVVEQSHQRWGEYRKQLEKMTKLTAKPHFATTITDEDERIMERHLQQLGYVD